MCAFLEGTEAGETVLFIGVGGHSHDYSVHSLPIFPTLLPSFPAHAFCGLFFFNQSSLGLAEV